MPKKVEALLSGKADIFISALTPWEMLLKRRFRGIVFTMDEFWAAILQMRASLLSLEGTHVDTYARLPEFEDHRDPFDRMLIAQAMSEGMILVSGDGRFKSYDVEVVWK